MNLFFVAFFPFCFSILLAMNVISTLIRPHRVDFSGKFELGENGKLANPTENNANGNNDDDNNDNNNDDEQLDYECIFNPFFPPLDFLSDFVVISDQNERITKEVIGEKGAKHYDRKQCNKNDRKNLSEERICDQILEEISRQEQFVNQFIIDSSNDNLLILPKSNQNIISEKETLKYEIKNKKIETEEVNSKRTKLNGSDFIPNLTKKEKAELFKQRNAQKLLAIVYFCIELTVSPIPIIGCAIVEKKTLPKCLMCPRMIAHFALSLLTFPPFYSNFGLILKTLEKQGKHFTVLKFIENVLEIIQKKNLEIDQMDEKLQNLQFYAIFYEYLNAFLKNNTNEKAIANSKCENYGKLWKSAKEFVQIYEQMFKNQLEKSKIIELGEIIEQLKKIKSGEKVLKNEK